MRLNPRRFTVKLSDGDLRRLRVFCTVTRCGGFAAAESELQMGLPSISRYIKDLEIRLGVRLCRRGRVGFQLTEQGRHVYAASLQLLGDLKRFETSMRSIHSGLAGTLNIGVIDTLITDPNLPLPEVLKDYKRKHPQVEFNIETKTTNNIEQSVIDGALDAGLVIGPVVAVGAGQVIGRRHISQLDYKLLYQERLNLYCSEEHPLFHEDLASIRLEEVAKYDYAGYRFLEEPDRSGPTRLLTRTACVDSVEAMATLVSSGCFLAMLPDHYVQSVWRLRNFKAILPDYFSISTHIELITRHGTSAPLVLALLDFVDHLETLPLPSMHDGGVVPLDRIDAGRKLDVVEGLGLGRGHC
ncbi:MAG: LysR family transcriptional regulator [Gammaproteobacteria bacterium]|nr:LysR family transcriptional regulator [Gammaproteobacteria bacterium]